MSGSCSVVCDQSSTKFRNIATRLSASMAPLSYSANSRANVLITITPLPISLGAIIRPNSHRWQSLPPSGLYRGLGAVHHCNTKWPTDAAPLHVANQLAKLSRIHNVS